MAVALKGTANEIEQAEEIRNGFLVQAERALTMAQRDLAECPDDDARADVEEYTQIVAAAQQQTSALWWIAVSGLPYRQQHRYLRDRSGAASYGGPGIPAPSFD